MKIFFETHVHIAAIKLRSIKSGVWVESKVIYLIEKVIPSNRSVGA